MSEKTFCKYCNENLSAGKEKDQGFHDTCLQIRQKYPDLDFLEQDDLMVIDKLKNIFLFHFYNIIDELVIFTHTEQNQKSKLELYLKDDRTVFREIKLENIEREDLITIWNIFKERKEFDVSIFKGLEINALNLLSKLKDKIIFPEIYLDYETDILIMKNSERVFQNNKYYPSDPLVVVSFSEGETEKSILSYESKTNAINDSFIKHIPDKARGFPVVFKEELFSTIEKQNYDFINNLIENLSKQFDSIEFRYQYDLEEEETIVLSCTNSNEEEAETQEDEWHNLGKIGYRILPDDDYSDYKHHYYEVRQNELYLELELSQEKNTKIISNVSIICDAQAPIEKILSLQWENLLVKNLLVAFTKSSPLQQTINKIQKFGTLKSLTLLIYATDVDQIETIDFKDYSTITIEDLYIRSRSFLQIKNINELKNIKTVDFYNVSLLDNFDYFINYAHIDGYNKPDNPFIIIPSKIKRLQLDDPVFVKIKPEISFECQKIVFYRIQITNETPIEAEKVNAIITIINSAKELDSVNFECYFSNIKDIFLGIKPLKSILFYLPTNHNLSGTESGLKDLWELRINSFRELGIPGFLKNLKKLQYLTLFYVGVYTDGMKEVLQELPNLKTIFVNEIALNAWRKIFNLIHLDLKVISYDRRKNIITNIKKGIWTCELCNNLIHNSEEEVFEKYHLECKINQILKLTSTEDKLNFFFEQLIQQNCLENYSEIKEFTIIHKLIFSLTSTQIIKFLEFLTYLKSIEILNNGLKYIDPAISNLKLLTKLTLPWNKLSSLPEELSKLKFLNNIILSNNDFTNFPNSSALVNIEILNLSDNKISSLPDSMQELKKLRHLNISHNTLRTISNSISEVEKLEILELHQNNLKEIPSSMGKLAKLRVLFLDHNSIEKIPVGFGDLKNIKIIILDSNNINEFPMELIELKGLNKLSLGNNKIKIIPKKIEELTSLEILNIMENPIEIIPEELFTQTRLRSIFLDITKLANFKKILQWIDNSFIEELSMNVDNIDEIPEELNNLKKLKVIRIIYKQKEVNNEEIKAIKQKLQSVYIYLANYERIKLKKVFAEYDEAFQLINEGIW